MLLGGPPLQGGVVTRGVITVTVVGVAMVFGVCPVPDTARGGGSDSSRQRGCTLLLLLLCLLLVLLLLLCLLLLLLLCLLLAVGYPLVQVVPLAAGPDERGRNEVGLGRDDEVALRRGVDLPLPNQHAQRVVEDLRRRRGDT